MSFIYTTIGNLHHLLTVYNDVDLFPHKIDKLQIYDKKLTYTLSQTLLN